MIDFNIDTRLFESDILSFALPITDPRVDALVEDYELQFEGRSFFITRVEDDHTEDNMALKRIFAEEAWMRLADKKRPGSTELTGPIGTTLAELLGPYGWGVIDLSGDEVTEFTLEATDASVLNLCWQWAKITGMELKFYSLGTYVVIAPEIGVALPYVLRYGKNLQSIRRTVVPPQVTRLYAYGRNELNISSHTGGAHYLEDYSYYTGLGIPLVTAQEKYQKDDIWIDDSFTESLPLFNVAQARLAILAQPGITYEASVIDLTAITGYQEGDYETGDSLWVQDQLLNLSSQSRVSRRVRFPYEPERDQVEIAFHPILIPDSTVSSTRSNPTKSWELFTSQNRTTERRVREFSTLLHRVGLRTIEDAEWIVHYNVHGTAVGDSTLTLEFMDDETLEPYWPTQTFTLVDGEDFSFQFSFGHKEVASGSHALVVRAYSDTGGAGLNIAQEETAFWILARGTTRQNVVLENSIRYDHTGLVQTYTVPDDVHEILIEAHGGTGHGASIDGHGYGAKVVARFPVTAGTTYDVYVGGAGGQPGGGWPNGGRGVTSNNSGSGGGGSSSVQPQGVDFLTTLPGVLIIAAGGGGHGSHDVGPRSAGHGSFYGGGPFPDGSAADGYPNSGATQTAPGVSVAGSAYDGAFGEGGDGAALGATLHSEGGGGGGGWYGGAAAGWDFQNSGGGGGSSWVDASAFDLDFEDNENTGNGFIIISWETPVDPG